MSRVYLSPRPHEGTQPEIRLLRACRQAREIILFSVPRQWMRAIGSAQQSVPYYDRTFLLLVYSYVILFFPSETVAREYLTLLCGVVIDKRNIYIRTFMDRMEGVQLFGCFLVLYKRTQALKPLEDTPQNTRLCERMDILHYRWLEWLIKNHGLTPDHPLVVEAVCDAERAFHTIVSDNRNEQRFKQKLSRFVDSFALGFASSLFLAFKTGEMQTKYEYDYIEGTLGQFGTTFASEPRTRATEVVDALYMFVRKCIATATLHISGRPFSQRLILCAPCGVECIRPPLAVPQLDSQSGAFFPSPADSSDDEPGFDPHTEDSPPADFDLRAEGAVPADFDLRAVWDDYAD